MNRHAAESTEKTEKPPLLSTPADARAVQVLTKLAIRSPEPISGGFVAPETMGWLYEHAKGMADELLTPNGWKAPEIIISVDVSNKRQLGHFKIGRDGLGLKWRISMNLRHLTRPRGNILSTLLHEMMHAWQHAYGKPPKNFKTHNSEFREVCERLGIPTDPTGHDLGINPAGPFAQYLEKHKISGNLGLVDRSTAGKGRGSPLKKWSCGCTNVRVAVATFDATCNLCGNHFEIQEK